MISHILEYINCATSNILCLNEGQYYSNIWVETGGRFFVCNCLLQCKGRDSEMKRRQSNDLLLNNLVCSVFITIAH
jgi:hypothetical protein